MFKKNFDGFARRVHASMHSPAINRTSIENIADALRTIDEMGYEIVAVPALDRMKASKDTDREPYKLQFPTMLRKMWTGREVQKWLDELPPLYAAVPTPAAQSAGQEAVARILTWKGEGRAPITTLAARTYAEYSTQDARDSGCWEEGTKLYAAPATLNANNGAGSGELSNAAHAAPVNGGETEMRDAAVRTVQAMGYTYSGGDRWRPAMTERAADAQQVGGDERAIFESRMGRGKTYTEREFTMWVDGLRLGSVRAALSADGDMQLFFDRQQAGFERCYEALGITDDRERSWSALVLAITDALSADGGEELTDKQIVYAAQTAGVRVLMDGHFGDANYTSVSASWPAFAAFARAIAANQAKGGAS